MKNKFILFILLFAAVQMATAQISTPAPSPAGKVYSKVGLTDVDISYSRPKMKGRKIFGSGDDFLVPFGKIWRTGANSGTIITTDKDLMVEGQNLPAGEYMLITIPGKDSWEVIFYKDKSIGGNMANHKKEDEQLRVSAKSGKLTEAVEALTFNISDLSADNKTAAIEIAWENTSVKVGVSTDFDKEVMEDISKKTKVNPNNYAAAANYYYDNGKDLDQAIEWMGKAIEANPNAFWNIHTKAQMQAKKGDKKSIKEAIATAEESLAKAKAADSDFGYVKLNEGLIAELNKK
jgi:tetratricopeptide (TPR) repeat protein